MAGRPKTRARIEEAERLAAEAAAAAATHAAPPAPARTQGAGVAPLGTRARTYAGGHAAPGGVAVPPNPGPRGRTASAWVDQQETQQLAELALHLQPSMTVRIFRRRPMWAAGWIDDIELDDGTTGELLAHIRSEYGGERYRVEILTHDGKIAYSSKLDIAGPVRRAGKVISRDEWERGASSSSSPATVAAPAAALGADGMMLQLFDRLIAAQQTQTTELAKSLRDIHAANQEMIAQVAGNQAPPQRAGIGETIRELAQAKQGIDTLRDTFRDDAPHAEPPPQPSMAAQVLGTALQNEFLKSQRGAAPAGPQPTGRLRIVRPAGAQEPPPQQAPAASSSSSSGRPAVRPINRK